MGAQASWLQIGSRTKLPRTDKDLASIQAASSQHHYHHPEKGLLRISYCLKFQSKGQEEGDEGKRKGEKESIKEREGKVCDMIFCSDLLNHQVTANIFWRESELNIPLSKVLFMTLLGQISYLPYILFNCICVSCYIPRGKKAFGIYFWSAIVSITMTIFIFTVYWVNYLIK